jgi:anaerobic selenocysteine-containing dehydrogenase
MSDDQVSRRSFLRAAAIGGAATIATNLVSTPATAASKVSQKSVKYQPTPKGDQRCDNCVFWQPPASCKIVDGTIAPSGWCTLYKKK